MQSTSGTSLPLRANARQWLRRWSVPLRAGITAVAAWVLTMAPLASSEAAHPATKACTAVALMAGVCAPALSDRYPRLGRHVGISLFVGACVAAWVMAASVGGLPPPGAVRAGLGAVAWAIYGLSWVEVRRPVRPRPSAGKLEPTVITHGLGPRRVVPKAVVLAAGTSVALALALVLLAWRVGLAERGVLGHTLAAGAALAVIATGARLGLLAARLPEHANAERAPVGAGLSSVTLRWLVLAILLGAAAAALYLTRP